MITEEQLKEWEEIEKKATSGPWTFIPREQLYDKESDVVLLNEFWGTGERPLLRVVPGWSWRNDETGTAGDAENGQFVAAARIAFPKLIQAYREQKKEIEELTRERNILCETLNTYPVRLDYTR